MNGECYFQISHCDSYCWFPLCVYNFVLSSPHPSLPWFHSLFKDLSPFFARQATIPPLYWKFSSYSQNIRFLSVTYSIHYTRSSDSDLSTTAVNHSSSIYHSPTNSIYLVFCLYCNDRSEKKKKFTLHTFLLSYTSSRTTRIIFICRYSTPYAAKHSTYETFDE